MMGVRQNEELLVFKCQQKQNKMKTSSELYNHGIELMRTAFGGTDILILSDLYRLEPDEFHKGGKLGADIWVEGNKVFMGYQEIEDMVLYGPHIAEEFVYHITKSNDESSTL